MNDVCDGVLLGHAHDRLLTKGSLRFLGAPLFPALPAAAGAALGLAEGAEPLPLPFPPFSAAPSLANMVCTPN